MRKILLLVLICISSIAYSQWGRWNLYNIYSSPFSTTFVGLAPPFQGVTYDADAQTYFSRMEVEPPDSIKSVINNIVVLLKNTYCTKWDDTLTYTDTTLWQRLDEVWFYGLHTEQASLLGLKGYKNSTNDNMIFTANYGFTGNGTNGKINTHYNFSSNGINYKTNSASFGYYVPKDTQRTASISDMIIRAGNTGLNELYTYSGSTYLRINTNLGYGISVVETSTKRMYIGSRTDTATVYLYRDLIPTTATMPSNGVINDTLFWGVAKISGSFSLWASKPYSLGFVGGRFSRKDVSNLHHTLMNYVRMNENKSLIVCDGNSLTLGSFGGATTPYPTLLQTALGTTYSVINLGVGGRTTLGMIQQYPTTAGAYYQNYFKRKILIAWEGTNDIFNLPNRGDTAYTRMVAYCEAARTQGYKVLVLTMLPYGSYEGVETQRGIYNTLLRNNWSAFADGLCDIALNDTIGIAGSQNNSTYYNADLTHLKDAGYSIVFQNIYNIIKDW